MGRAASNQKVSEKTKSYFSKRPDHDKAGDELDLLNINSGVNVDEELGLSQLFLHSSEDYAALISIWRVD